MSGDERTPSDPKARPAGSFDWGSPRWREGDQPTDEEERGRRFRDDAEPHQRGAIDEAGSVPMTRDPREDTSGS